MTVTHTPNREEQALAEVGRTAVGRSSAVALLVLFLLAIAGLPLLQSALDWTQAEAGEDLVARLAPALDRLIAGSAAARPAPGAAAPGTGGLARLLEINRRLQSAIDDAEEVLESGSVLRQSALPRLQWLQSALLGLGNEEAYVGRDGWLFYRADIDYVIGPGFLDPEVLTRRSRGGDLTATAPVPDPRPAITALHAELVRRGIRLIVMPTPVKPTIHPEAFSYRLQPQDAPLDNLSFPTFLADLSRQGVEILDPAPLLAAAAREDQAQFLATDTHWTPQAVETVAAALGQAIGLRTLSPRPSTTTSRRR